MAPFGKTLLLNQDSSPERRKKRRKKHLPKKLEKQVGSQIILLEERKAEEKQVQLVTMMDLLNSFLMPNTENF